MGKSVIKTLTNSTAQNTKIKILLVQFPLGDDFNTQEIEQIKTQKPRYICFPEYYFVSQDYQSEIENASNEAYFKEQIKGYSIDFECTIIGGTMISKRKDRYYNTCYIFHKGKEISHYDKVNLFRTEKKLLTKGGEYPVVHTAGIPFGVLVCADVFHKKGFLSLKSKGARIIFMPTFSPLKKESVEAKFERDKKLYLSAAQLSGCYIIKVCSVGSYLDNKSQGRSLVVSPEEIIMRVLPEEEQKKQLIFVELDLCNPL